MKYEKYDHVQIKDLSGNSCISHFPHSTDAIVMYSYREKYGGDEQGDDKYCLLVNGHGGVSWYRNGTFDLIEHGRKDLLDDWEAKMKADNERESDLDWIFSHGKEIARGEGYSGCVAEALYKCLSNKSMWGSRGEGIVFYTNAVCVHALAKPFLESEDKDAWLKACEDWKAGIKAKETEDAQKV